MDLINRFLTDTPSVYDLASYLTIVMLLIVVISMLLRQRQNSRAIHDLQSRVGPNIKITYDFGDKK